MWLVRRILRNLYNTPHSVLRAGSRVCGCSEVPAGSPDQTWEVRDGCSRSARVPAIPNRTHQPGGLWFLRGRSASASAWPRRRGLASAGCGAVPVLCDLDGGHRFLRNRSCSLDLRSRRNLPEGAVRSRRPGRGLAIRPRIIWFKKVERA